MGMITPVGKHIHTNERYHSDKHYFSSSQVKEALKSPAHFKFYVIDQKGKKKATASMDKGTLAHTVILEPHKFDEEYVVHTGDVTPTGLIPKIAHTNLAKTHPHLKLVTQADYDFALRARQNFEAHPHMSDLLFDTDCEYEPSYYVLCEQTGLRLRVRPDCINLKRGYIVDLKTSRARDKQEFAKDAKYVYHYDLSAYMYVMVIYQLTGVLCDFYWAIAGTEDMCPVSMYKVSFETMEQGKGKFFKSIDNLKSALAMPDRYVFQSQIEEL